MEKEKFKRIFVVVLDSLGVGAMPDAEQFGDAGANTLGHIADYRYKKGKTLQYPQPGENGDREYPSP